MKAPSLTDWRTTSGATLATLILLAALLGPFLSPYGPERPDFAAILAPPTPAHWLGTDDLGRDILARILTGARISLLVATTAITAATLLGAAIGFLSGALGGRTERILMRLMDVLLAFPGILLALGVTAALGPSALNTAIAIALVNLPVFARLACAQARIVAALDFIAAARATGRTEPAILLRHIIPNALAPVLVQASLLLASAIITESYLSFLGLGVQPPTPTWGNMLRDATGFLDQSAWLAWFPGLASFDIKDPLTYAFTLRPNLTFHDGTQLDAAAAKFNIDRYNDPATASIRKSDYGPFAACETTGPLTFIIRLSAPYAPLPLVLTNRAGMMVSPTALKALGPDFATKAVGCGPYRFAAWTKNSELTLEKFPAYWRGTDHGFDRLTFRPIPDETVRLANLRSGTLHLIDSIPPQSVATLAREPAIKVAQMPSMGFNAWSLNTTRAPFNDPRIRRAFLAAVDRDVIQRVVFFGTGQPAFGPLSPAISWAYDPTFTATHDPAASKKLLAEAGQTSPVPVPVPVTITVTVTNSPQMVRAAQIVQAQAADAGFKVEVKQIDPTSLITVLRARDFDVCMSPWSGRYDPDGNMFFYFTQGGPNNFPGYDSPAMTDLLRRARTETDRATRVKLYHEAQRLLATDAPMLFLHFDAILQASAATLRWTQYPDAVFRLYDARMI